MTQLKERVYGDVFDTACCLPPVTTDHDVRITSNRDDVIRCPVGSARTPPMNARRSFFFLVTMHFFCAHHAAARLIDEWRAVVKGAGSAVTWDVVLPRIPCSSPQNLFAAAKKKKKNFFCIAGEPRELPEGHRDQAQVPAACTVLLMPRLSPRLPQEGRRQTGRPQHQHP